MRHHVRALGSAVRRLLRTPLAMLFNVAVVGIALALPVALHTLVANVQSYAVQLPAEPQITVFLTRDATPAQVADIGRRLKAHGSVRKVVYVPRDEALRALERTTGLTDVLQGLEQNPLPDAFVVDSRDGAVPALEALRDDVAKWPKVETVQLDSVWAQRLQALLGTLRAGVLGLTLILAFAVVAVTFNTIRLQVLTQQADIEVAQLFGATNAYIRRPFLYDGALMGALGGLAGCACVAGIAFLLNRHLAVVSQLYGGAWSVKLVGWSDWAAILGFAALLGWLGAWLSVSRHLAVLRSR